MLKYLIHFAILGAFCIATFSGCRRNDQATSDGNILQVPLSSEISTLDPARSYDTISGSVVYQAYEQLYEYHYLKRPYVLIPLLAESMPEVDKSGLRYSIKIKKNIQYHDDPSFKGVPRFVKAQDFITQIKRLAFIPTHSNGWWLFENKIKGLDTFVKEAGNDLSKFTSLPIQGLQTPDDHTLIIELREPFPQLMYVLAMSFVSPIPMESVTFYNNLLDDVMIGTGPFRMEKWNKLGNLKMTRFAAYHGSSYPSQGDRYSNENKLLQDAGKKLPFLDGINFHIMKESQTRWLNFRAKKIDFLVIPKDNYDSAIDPSGQLNRDLVNEKIDLEIAPTKTYWWLSFNCNDPVLGKNLNLRKAIAHAVDIDRYIKVFTNNIGQKANSIYPPGIPGYNPSSQLPYEYNIEKAKHFLKLAGYPEGKGLPPITYDVRDNSATNRQQAEFIQGELEKIGMKVDVMLNTFPGFLNKARTGKLQFWQDGWAMDYPDAENSLQLLISKNHPPGPNSTYYSNKEFDDLFERVKSMSDGPDKYALMVRMENIIHRDLPWIMQYYARNYILYHHRLKNYRYSDLVSNYMKYLRLSDQ
ncbi:MAG: hypothetical protein A2X86_05860 [Bdellovibrionales bacterium GWA2_49_15]|nr:MAG: hypothetical protein A2X86_05860 [Bdellovibrionales bacterium GWA2_49_15]